MGCASSKPNAVPASSSPSSVTQSNKPGQEKSVRFAEQPTEISDKSGSTPAATTPTVANHSTTVLTEVVSEGNTTAAPAEAAKAAEHTPVHATAAATVAHVETKHAEPAAAAPAVAAAPAAAEAAKHHEPVKAAEPVHAHAPAPAAVEVKHEDVKVEVAPEPVKAAEPAPVVAPAAAAAAPAAAATATAAPAVHHYPAVVTPTTPTNDPKRVPDKKKGYMLKQGHVVKNWKNRFFILEDGLLTYYESSTANPPFGVNKKGELNLKDVTVKDDKSLVTLVAPKGGSDLVLEIKYPNEREEWIAALKAHIAWLKATSN